MEIYNGTYSVYAHINKQNGKMYIGITGRPVEHAAKALGIARSSISECCSGKRKSAGGYHWRFA